MLLFEMLLALLLFDVYVSGLPFISVRPHLVDVLCWKCCYFSTHFCAESVVV